MTPRQLLRRSLKPTLMFIAGSSLLFSGVGIYRSSLENPDPTLLINDRRGEFIAEISHDEQRGHGFWPIKQLPPRVVAATLAIEDRHFWSHPGVDPIAVARALWQNLTSSRRISGASTIAMQLARMQKPAQRSYFNKLVEAATAVALTLRHGREQVLKQYLRLVPYGNNIHGIGYAARRYLNKPVADLSWSEIAFLSAIPQSPGRMNPYSSKGKKRAIKRGQQILTELHKQAVISDAEYSLATKQIELIYVPQRQPRPNYAMHAILKIEDEIRQLPQQALQDLDNFTLTAALDLELQSELSDINRSMLETWRRFGAGNSALIVIDRKDNSVLSWIGSGDYFDDSYSGAIDYAETKRSSGSTLKPFFYALALERGDVNAATLLDDIPGSGLALRNADRHYLGPVLPRQALANSRNLPVAQIVKRTGLYTGYTFLHTLNLHQEQYPAQHYGLGIALGALPVSLEDLVGAYTAMADDGVYSGLNWFKELPANPRKRVLSSATARQVTLFLSDPAARLPSFPRMGHTEYPFPVAVKTGTSQGFRDAWTIAYSQRYLVGAWLGDPDNQPMHKLGGYASAARLVQRALLLLHKKQLNGQYDLGFPKPEGYIKVKLCANSGKLAGQHCEHYFEEWMKPDQVPQQEDQGVRRIMVDNRSGTLAKNDTPVKYRQLRTVLDLPSRYAVWASKQSGMPMVNDNYLMRASYTQPKSKNESVQLEILTPKDGVRIISNPEIPTLSSTIELNASVTPSLKQITWYVDGKPFKNANYPYNVRLPLTKGQHRVQARVPLTDERSKVVIFSVE